MIQYIKNSSLTDSSEKKHNTFINKWIELTPTNNLLYVILFPAHSLALLESYLKQKDTDSPMKKINHTLKLIYIHIFRLY